MTAEIISFCKQSIIKRMTTEDLLSHWKYMAEEDGVYGEFVVEDAGHRVNGIFMDDLYYELESRGYSQVDLF